MDEVDFLQAAEDFKGFVLYSKKVNKPWGYQAKSRLGILCQALCRSSDTVIIY